MKSFDENRTRVGDLLDGVGRDGANGKRERNDVVLKKSVMDVIMNVTDGFKNS